MGGDRGCQCWTRQQRLWTQNLSGPPAALRREFCTFLHERGCPGCGTVAQVFAQMPGRNRLASSVNQRRRICQGNTRLSSAVRTSSERRNNSCAAGVFPKLSNSFRMPPVIGRILLILAIAWPAMLVLRDGVAHEMSCCAPASSESAVTEMCCDDRPALHHCGQPADGCVCGVQRSPAPQSPPKAPSTRPDEPVAHRLPRHDSGVVLLPRDDERVARRPATVIVAALRTHNETQALLSIWRT